MERLLGRASANDESEWISVSDLMAGLMVIFLFIAIVYIRPLVLQREEAVAEKERLAAAQQTVREIVVAWRQSEIGIHRALEAEFGADLARWNAEIDEPTLTFRFRAPDVLFDRNEARLKPQFKAILGDFFPRYLGVLTDFRDVIEEVRIEGHTSSEWSPGTGPLEAYFRNMELSQARTRAVLEYVLGLKAVRPHRDWSIAHVTANGLSSSRLIRTREGGENPSASRRVEFRVRTKAQERIVTILETMR